MVGIAVKGCQRLRAYPALSKQHGLAQQSLSQNVHVGVYYQCQPHPRYKRTFGKASGQGEHATPTTAEQSASLQAKVDNAPQPGLYTLNSVYNAGTTPAGVKQIDHAARRREREVQEIIQVRVNDS
jgi:hypothetical protein